ncbi:MAG: alcohol dehydrogenase catalytic domain-containing protein [Gemmataceae bacterium]
MLQAVIVAPDRFEVRSVRRPLIGDGEMLLRTLACGICSGDLMPWYLAKKVGTVLGHEPVGRAVEVGHTVTHIKPGDLVFAHHHAPCLRCTECERGAHVHCATWKRTALDPGGMAEYIRLPAEIVKADAFAVNDLHPELALFIEPLGCCIKAFRRVGGRIAVRNSRVAVVGCGIMGLLNIQTARALEAREVIGVEPDPHRRELAARCGAVPMTPEEASGTLRRAADIVVIGPGSPDVIRQSLGHVRDAGVACLFTPTASGVTTAVDLGDLYFRDVSLVPSYSCGPWETRFAYQALRSGRIDPQPLITHRFPLTDVQRAFDTAKAGGATVKVIVTFPEEPDR